ncbi:sugar phosphate isomerase/epimerase family protein [Siphonobacter sp. SORGH_AS_0500]|uniref:sugar phosphate isomerase/epimerase family protein n=1 Tax=Siphonobacter sp. SORGH_AS_0500 TaxID=1864824 RepID=UPI002855886D|nr:sugar phosphate isomerase/epimerase family protein [Siphonobacter sp. SORGH_AS_0500]MDR6196461.1 D-psicose/D-tagatose/L-ribulose 3-epimerase [Siphonobacter sp. SORGH_AS_0500]
MKFGASLLTWTLPAWTAETGAYAIQQSAVYGFDVLEILLPPSMDFDAPTVKRQLQAANLDVICSLNLPAFAHIPFHPKEALSLIKKALDQTAALEATLLAGVLHGGIGVFSGKPLTAAEEDTLCEVWAEGTDYAQKLGITVAIEPINRYESYVCTSASDVLRIIDRVKSPNLGLHLDTFHMNIEEANFYDPVVTAASHLKHVHMTESDRGMLGEGNVHWNDLFRGLAEVNYAGALVLENFSSSIPGMAEAVSLWRPSKYDAETLAKGSLAFMKEKAAEFGLI